MTPLRRLSRIVVVLTIASAVIGVRSGRAAVEGMIEVRLPKLTVEGQPLDWNDREVHLLGRDGRLWRFDPAEVIEYRKTAARFRAYSPSELRAALLCELGDDYEVSGTGHYLVAHPRGQRDRWAERFEDLYRSFVHYFSVRGFDIQRLEYPLIGIVCKDRADFRRSAAADLNFSGGIEGYYNLVSNRITIYDMGAEGDSSDWKHNASVLIHEATHQTAFNTGVHGRASPPPTWAVEGLAMLFEAPGVYDSRNHTRAADRVNRERLAAFRRLLAPRHRPEMIASLIASDEWFRVRPATAYAEAWAMSFFLAETEPRKYMRYLKLTGGRPPFREYTAAERTADFTAIFGGDWRMLEARFLRFIEGVE
ncbi:MAG: DUF1570 domain-containing protein [Pirellulales bacterium]|nr:DUF1570 domain-containing protein [Pirellulales bacterium]